MSSQNMADKEKLAAARLGLISLAETLAGKNLAIRSLAREEIGGSWLWMEYQHFFLSGIYGDLTGAKQACKQDIIQAFVTGEAADWLELHCANPYWFWSTLAAAATHAESIPLSRQDCRNGAKSLFDKISQELGRTHGISGWPSGYSGEYLPWHVRDSFVRNILWNNEQGPETGIEYGLVLTQRFKPAGGLKSKLAGKHPPYTVQLIFNPLFDALAKTPPVTP